MKAITPINSLQNCQCDIWCKLVVQFLMMEITLINSPEVFCVISGKIGTLTTPRIKWGSVILEVWMAYGILWSSHLGFQGWILWSNGMADGRSVSTTALAPKPAATSPARPVPAPSSTTFLPQGVALLPLPLVRADMAREDAPKSNRHKHPTEINTHITRWNIPMPWPGLSLHKFYVLRPKPFPQNFQNAMAEPSITCQTLSFQVLFLDAQWITWELRNEPKISSP